MCGVLIKTTNNIDSTVPKPISLCVSFWPSGISGSPWQRLSPLLISLQCMATNPDDIYDTAFFAITWSGKDSIFHRRSKMPILCGTVPQILEFGVTKIRLTMANWSQLKLSAQVCYVSCQFSVYTARWCPLVILTASSRCEGNVKGC